MNRENKFRAFDKFNEDMFYSGERLSEFFRDVERRIKGGNRIEVMEYTGLKDKNGKGLMEVFEGDIIGSSSIVGNIYETDPRETDLVIPRLGTKAWQAAYTQAVERGFDYSE